MYPVPPTGSKRGRVLSRSFRWTSRADARRQLLAFLRTAPPEPSDGSPSARWAAEREHVQAAGLLPILAVPEDADALRSLLLDRGQLPWVRVYGARALASQGLSVRATELAGLLEEERRWREEREACRAVRQGPPELRELLPLVRGEEGLATARAAVRRLAPADRAQALLEASRVDHAAGPEGRELLEEIYQAWWATDRHRLEEELNDQVASRTAERAASRRLLLARLREAPDAVRRRLLPSVAAYPEFAALEAEAPELWREARARFLRPVPAYGADDDTPWPPDLLPRLEAEIGRIGDALAAPAEEPEPGPQPRAERKAWAQRRRAEVRRRLDLEQRGHIVMNLLLDRTAGRDRLEALLAPGLHPFFWPKLEDGLWRHDPARAVAWASAALSGSTSSRGVRVLSRVAEDPRPHHAELLRFATGHAHASARYVGLHGLDALGAGLDDGLLRALAADADPFVRLRARAARAARGDARSERALIEEATARVRPVRVRAEATRWLAALDPVQHAALLEEALLTDHETTDDGFTPVAEEAAFGVARSGTDEALTALVRAALAAPGNAAASAIEEYVRAILAWREGEPCAQIGGVEGRAPSPAPLPGGPPLWLYPDLWRRALVRHPGEPR